MAVEPRVEAVVGRRASLLDGEEALDQCHRSRFLQHGERRTIPSILGLLIGVPVQVKGEGWLSDLGVGTLLFRSGSRRSEVVTRAGNGDSRGDVHPLVLPCGSLRRGHAFSSGRKPGAGVINARTLLAKDHRRCRVLSVSQWRGRPRDGGGRAPTCGGGTTTPSWQISALSPSTRWSGS